MWRDARKGSKGHISTPTILWSIINKIFWTYTYICWPLGIFLWEGKTPIIIFSNVFRNSERFPITQGHRAMAYIFNKHKLSHPYMVEANAIDYLIWVQKVLLKVEEMRWCSRPLCLVQCVKCVKLWSTILTTCRSQEKYQTLILQGLRPL